MFIADEIRDYQVLDTGDGMKLESWSGVILARPDPQVIWAKQKPGLWQKADAVYRRSNTGGGHWEYNKKLPERWTVGFRNLKFYVRPTGFKHTGLFPEQSANWAFMMEKIKESGIEQPEVLNLFAYTGGATMACAAAGAKVTHVDAAKSMVAWAKENAALSGLADRPIRYMVDDCLKFVLREQRRGRRYHGIIMDPPSYGRGADGQVWKVEQDLYNLVVEAAKLLADDALFFIINSYTTGLSSVVSENLLQACICPAHGGKTQADNLVLPIRGQEMFLPCGTAARWTR
ncbi:MAG: class I SAM-dependent methyltransferase [Christensenellaceae bacterium]|nr:class I SAM-dependent methyltransferase [Christensenellaceae bacterium]